MAWKFPGALCSKTEDGAGIDTWKHPTVPKPNQIEVARILTEYEAHLAAVEYRRLRAAEYPSIGDQLDALWKGIQGLSQATGAMLPKEVADMADLIQSVKTKYPKPEGK